MHRIEHRLERLGEGFFALTLAVAVAYLVGAAVGWDAPAWWSYVVTSLTAGLPALGSATYGVRLIGDFNGTAERSARTGAALGTISGALRRVNTLPALTVLAQSSSAAMLGDVSHWRLAKGTRTLALPG